MAELKPYLAYKDSGVEWIGEVPNSWIKSKVKHYANLNGRIGYRGYTVQDIVMEGEGAVTLSPSNLNKGKVSFEKSTYITWEKYYESPEIQIEKGDIVFCKTGSTYGKVAIIIDLPEKSTINPQLVIFKPNKNINNKFLFYFLYSTAGQNQVETIVGGSTMPTITQESLENITFYFPSIKEQIMVAQFLDDKSADIDSLILDKGRLIELLEEKRQAIITETVTKGLNPNVKMKDSGIEWIGEMPEHWKTSKIKYYSDMKTGATPSRNVLEYWEKGTVKWMTSGEINQEYINNISNTITTLGYENSSTSILPINTVMIALNGQGKTKGKVGVLKTESTCNQSLVGFICDEKKLHYQYLYYFLKSKYADLRGLVGDGLRDGISLGLLKTLYISLPEYKDQIRIAETIQAKEVEINLLKTEINYTIERLKEYRESLIYEAVTGKIDLRDYEVDSSGDISYVQVAETKESYNNKD